MGMEQMDAEVRLCARRMRTDEADDDCRANPPRAQTGKPTFADGGRNAASEDLLSGHVLIIFALHQMMTKEPTLSPRGHRELGR